MNKYQQAKMIQAFEYADRGWHVIPVSRNKRPILEDWTQDCSIDKDLIREWFKTYEWMNIGIVTGQKSGFFVVDLDVKSEPNGLASLQKQYGEAILDYDVKKYLTQATATDGRHLLFKCGDIEAKTCSKVLPNVDFRGEGGQVVVAPSSAYVNGQWVAYRWNNLDFEIAEPTEWVLDLLQRSGEVKKRTYNIEGALRGLTEGERDEGLFSFALMMRKNKVPFELAVSFIKVAAEKCNPPFSESVAVEKAESAYSDSYATRSEKTQTRKEQIFAKIRNS